MGLADPSCDLPKVVKVKPTRVHAAIPHGTSNADLGNIPRTNNNLRTVAWPQTLFMNYIRALCKTAQDWIAHRRGDARTVGRSAYMTVVKRIAKQNTNTNTCACCVCFCFKTHEWHALRMMMLFIAHVCHARTRVHAKDANKRKQNAILGCPSPRCPSPR